MVLETPAPKEHEYRIYTLGNFALGRDEHIALSRDTLSQINPTDPHFTRMRDVEAMDLIIDVPHPVESVVEPLVYNNSALTDHVFDFNLDIDLEALDATSSPGDMVLDSLPRALFADVHRLAEQLDGLVGALPDAESIDDALRQAAKQLRSKSTSALPSSSSAPPQQKKGLQRFTTPAMLPIGPGAAPLPAVIDTSPDPRSLSIGSLPYTTILIIDSDLCNTSPLSLDLVTSHTILIIRRGGCSFSKKLSAIPSFPPAAKSLQLVLVVSFGTDDTTRPLVDEVQLTPKGLPRRHPICLALVPGGQTVWDTFLRGARTIGVVDDNGVINTKSRVVPAQAENMAIDSQAKEIGAGASASKKKAKKTTKAKTTKGKKEEKEVPGIGVRRRYYFTSKGIRISNLIVT